MSSILDHKYVEERKKYLAPLPLGEGIIDALKDQFVFTQYEYTRNMEKTLDQIADGKGSFWLLTLALIILSG